MRTALLAFALGMASSALIAQGGTFIVPDAVSADPKHYLVAYENDVIRVLRVRYGPGEKSVMHAHPANCAIFVTDQQFNFTVPDGTGGEESIKAGQFGCGDANVHLPENTGTNTAEMIIVELKNRQTFKE
jgi:quercetin dioxygenase-like cupin family protein